MEEYTATDALPTPSAEAVTTEISQDDTLGVDPDQVVTAPNQLTDVPISEDYKQGQSLRAPQVAAMAGFIDTTGGAQASCLSLCNTCREHAPLQRIRIYPGVPPSILDIVFPSSRQAKTEESSRVSPFQRVLKVHILWTVLDSLGHRRLEETEKGRSEAVETEGRSVDTHEAGLGSDVNFDTSSVKWPAGTKDVSLCSFNHRVDALTWPVGLERLSFGRPLMAHPAFFSVPDIFNMPLDGATFPRGLWELFLGDGFNEPIEGVVWPGGLERLSLPGFNQSIQDVQWPPGLKALEFVSPSTIKLMTYGIGDSVCGQYVDDHVDMGGKYAEQGLGRFNRPLDETLPLSLNIVWLSKDFHWPLEGVAWPSTLSTLGLPFDSCHYPFSASIEWPPNLKHLFMVNKPLEGLVEGMRYPPDSEVTILPTFDGRYCNYDLECYGRGKDPSGDYCFWEEELNGLIDQSKSRHNMFCD